MGLAVDTEVMVLTFTQRNKGSRTTTHSHDVWTQKATFTIDCGAGTRAEKRTGDSTERPQKMQGRESTDLRKDMRCVHNH